MAGGDIMTKFSLDFGQVADNAANQELLAILGDSGFADDCTEILDEWSKNPLSFHLEC